MGVNQIDTVGPTTHLWFLAGCVGVLSVVAVAVISQVFTRALRLCCTVCTPQHTGGAFRWRGSTAAGCDLLISRPICCTCSSSIIICSLQVPRHRNHITISRHGACLEQHIAVAVLFQTALPMPAAPLSSTDCGICWFWFSLLLLTVLPGADPELQLSGHIGLGALLPREGLRVAAARERSV